MRSWKAGEKSGLSEDIFMQKRGDREGDEGILERSRNVEDAGTGAGGALKRKKKQKKKEVKTNFNSVYYFVCVIMYFCIFHLSVVCNGENPYI